MDLQSVCVCVWQVSRQFTVCICLTTNPRDPITLSDDDWGVQSPPQQGI